MTLRVRAFFNLYRVWPLFTRVKITQYLNWCDWANAMAMHFAMPSDSPCFSNLISPEISPDLILDGHNSDRTIGHIHTLPPLPPLPTQSSVSLKNVIFRHLLISPHFIFCPERESLSQRSNHQWRDEHDEQYTSPLGLFEHHMNGH
jgi:hypothetical protein